MMISHSIMAKPYAQAAFEFATEQDQLASWATFLTDLAQLLAIDQIKFLINYPNIDQEHLLQILLDLLPQPNSYQVNFLQTLAYHHRFSLVPQINLAFHDLYNEYQQVVMVKVVSAYPLSNTQSQTLSAALAHRLQAKINLHTEVDNNLIGGAIIYFGSTIIDNSIRHSLQQLHNYIACRDTLIMQIKS